MQKYRTLAVPEELVEFFEKLAEKMDKPTKWSEVAKNALWGYHAMHRAQGNLE